MPVCGWPAKQVNDFCRVERRIRTEPQQTTAQPRRLAEHLVDVGGRREEALGEREQIVPRRGELERRLAGFEQRHAVAGLERL